MQRIDTGISTQIGDISRPRHTEQDQTIQVREARRVEKASDSLAEREVQADDIDGILAQIQKVVEAATGRALSFKVDDEEKDLIVTVKDSDGEVIRQIPSEEIVELRKRLEDLVGGFMDTSA
jgi:flagellar protein FlaG